MINIDTEEIQGDYDWIEPTNNSNWDGRIEDVDTLLVYRITRAPQRRVFKIDVGLLSPRYLILN